MKRLITHGVAMMIVAVLAACGGGGGLPYYVPAPSPLTVTTASLPAATVGMAYSQTLVATGGAPPYQWSTMGGDPIPAGLTLNPNTGVLSGTPTTAGTATVIFMVTDSNPATMVHKSLTITVNAPGSPLTVTTNTLPAASVGVAYSQTLTATGGMPPYQWSTMGGDPIPAGLSLNAVTGVLSGTPTVAGTANVRFMITDANPMTMEHKILTVTVTTPGGMLGIVTTTLPAATVGQPYSQALVATGGTPPYQWSTMGGDPIPAGLTLDKNTGILSGIPTAAGTASIRFMITDANPMSMEHMIIPFTVNP